MIKSSDILADMHTHTLFSRHAYSTLKENVTEAKNKGVKYLAATDHYFLRNDDDENMNELSRLMYVHNVKPQDGVVIIPGAEFDLMLPFRPRILIDSLYKTVLWRPAGIHSWYANVNVSEYRAADIYKVFKQVVFDDDYYRMYVKPTAFSHIERQFNNVKDPENVEAALHNVVDLAIEQGIYLEINESSIRNGVFNGNIERMKQWVSYAMSKGAKFCLGTDAHYADEVGDFTSVIEFVNSMGVEKQSILNCNEQELQQFVVK